MKLPHLIQLHNPHPSDGGPVKGCHLTFCGPNGLSISASLQFNSEIPGNLKKKKQASPARPERTSDVGASSMRQPRRFRAHEFTPPFFCNEADAHVERCRQLGRCNLVCDCSESCVRVRADPDRSAVLTHSEPPVHLGVLDRLRTDERDPRFDVQAR